MNAIRVTFVLNYGNAASGAEQEILGTARLDVANATTDVDTTKAFLYLYDDDGKELDSGVLTSMTKNVAVQVSAIVWLDGSAVTNGDFASALGQTLTGSLNLQFTTDVTLTPATNTTLKGVTG
jgi:hypothetical protein